MHLRNNVSRNQLLIFDIKSPTAVFSLFVRTNAFAFYAKQERF